MMHWHLRPWAQRSVTDLRDVQWRCIRPGMRRDFRQCSVDEIG